MWWGSAQYALADWWGLLDADPLLLGVVVVTIAALAFAYVIARLLRRED